MTSLEALTLRFRFNEKVLERALDGFAGDDWVRRPAEGGSHALWILGHLAASRRNLLRGTGREMPAAAWEAQFSRGSQPVEVADPSSPSMLKNDFLQSGNILAEHLTSLTSEQASGPFPRKLSDGSTTVEGAAHFYHWHESYHLGQLGILRRVSGKPGIA